MTVIQHNTAISAQREASRKELGGDFHLTEVDHALPNQKIPACEAL